QGLPLEEAAVDAAIAAAVRAAAWPEDWTDPATQRAFWMDFYRDILTSLGHADDGLQLAEALFASFSDPASYRLFDDVRPALDELAGRGITLGVVSNFEPWLADILALQGIDHLFATVAISGVLGVAKPDPRIFEAALAEAGADPSATVHVGDQPANDVAAARAVGITPVLIDRFARYPEPDDAHRVEDLAGLVKLVNGGSGGPKIRPPVNGQGSG
ncbi:MAG TPA: HAD-IA family hydrolase, partial [Actinomycetota bacterium]|nr:HAD-IA family hydrolase [Actinomycetota bacterium]